jgi:hypothetical protein
VIEDSGGISIFSWFLLGKMRYGSSDTTKSASCYIFMGNDLSKFFRGIG